MSIRTARCVRYVAPFLCAAAWASARLSAAEVVVHEPPPGVIQIAPEIQKSVDRMLERSPTFRDQYQRVLNTPRLIISARLEPGVLSGSMRARSTIRRYASGLVIVVMEIGPGGDLSQWIAHEFEHVVEQLDGVDVRAAAARGDHSWYSSGHAVETMRAMRVGRQVQNEIRRAKTSSDKLVEATQ